METNVVSSMWEAVLIQHPLRDVPTPPPHAPTWEPAPAIHVTALLVSVYQQPYVQHYEMETTSVLPW
jgi:hypothetical protein